MSTRAHVISKYQIEYGSEGLAWGQDFLVALAGDYINDACTGGEYHSEEAIWEFDKNEFKAMVDTLEAMSESEYNEKCKDEWGVNPEDYPKDYTVELFKQWLNETPETSAYVRISWF